MQNRRQVIGAFGGAVGGALTSRLAFGQSALRYRRPAGTVQNDPNLRTYAYAYRIMTGVDPNHPVSREIRQLREAGGVAATICHPLSWEHQVNLHAGYWGQHGTWRFLPWHRLQLMNFENIVMQLTGNRNFAMPFWDPREAQLLPWDFRDPAGVFYIRERAAYASTMNYRQELQARIPNWNLAYLDDPSLLRFAGGFNAPGRVEFSTHNLVHGLIGGRGWMGFPETAPRDPIFWLHHANIDRVWASWQRRQNAMRPDSRSYYPEFLSEQIIDAFVPQAGCGTPRTWRPSDCRRAYDVIDHRALGYDYAPLYSLPAFAPSVDASSWVFDGDESTVDLLSTAPVTGLFGKPAILPMVVPSTARAARSSDSRVEIVDAELKISIARSGFENFAAKVVIGPEGANRFDEGFVELISPFGFQHMHHESGNDIEFTLAAKGALTAASLLNPNIEIQVSAVPLWGGLDASSTLPVSSAKLRIKSQKLKKRQLE